MTISHGKPLRLWPGVAAVALVWLVILAVPILFPDAAIFAVLFGAAGGLVVAIWWAFFSRAPWPDRAGAIVLMIGALIAAPRAGILHPSIATGMMGMMFVIYAIPVLSLALVVWAAATRNLSNGPRRAGLIVAMILACGAFTLLRSDGVTGDGTAQFAWRWSKSPEQQLLAKAVTEEPPAVPAPVAAPVAVPVEPKATEVRQRDEWPGFRGPGRDGIVRGVKIKTDWAASPPVEMWRRPIGPGWSSFAVHGDLIYTQEQRGEDEIVSCYKLGSGQPVWTHKDSARFWESNAGAGPRGTPVFSNGRIYTHGATGIVNALDAGNGSLVWSRNAASDTNTKVPGWGFASSPLVVDDLVVVASSGKLIAYELATGDQRWSIKSGGGGYSSPHLMKADGISQVLLLSGSGAISVAPSDGKLLWQLTLPDPIILQPAQLADGDILISTSDAMGGKGVGRFKVKHGASDWTVEERWTSAGLKPYFNDFVVNDGHAFGFDGRILSCIDLEDGKRKWKGGRYGNGQLVLLREQKLLLVLSEEGEVAIVKATPDEFTEVARFKAIEGKTWNHPAIVGDTLLVRNGEEMAAFRLPQ